MFREVFAQIKLTIFLFGMRVSENVHKLKRDDNLQQQQIKLSTRTSPTLLNLAGGIAGRTAFFIY